MAAPRLQRLLLRRIPHGRRPPSRDPIPRTYSPAGAHRAMAAPRLHRLLRRRTASNASRTASGPPAGSGPTTSSLAPVLTVPFPPRASIASSSAGPSTAATSRLAPVLTAPWPPPRLLVPPVHHRALSDVCRSSPERSDADRARFRRCCRSHTATPSTGQNWTPSLPSWLFIPCCIPRSLQLTAIVGNRYGALFGWRANFNVWWRLVPVLFAQKSHVVFLSDWEWNRRVETPAREPLVGFGKVPLPQYVLYIGSFALVSTIQEIILHEGSRNDDLSFIGENMNKD
ncbi:hypothetical protein ZWY2020_051188 [Hordeum vulgare]|nr:hypothetical protein ZWY2020_051188 [Hordeum vulgare]